MRRNIQWCFPFSMVPLCHKALTHSCQNIAKNLQKQVCLIQLFICLVNRPLFSGNAVGFGLDAMTFTKRIQTHHVPETLNSRKIKISPIPKFTCQNSKQSNKTFLKPVNPTTKWDQVTLVLGSHVLSEWSTMYPQKIVMIKIRTTVLKTKSHEKDMIKRN